MRQHVSSTMMRGPVVSSSSLVVIVVQLTQGNAGNGVTDIAAVESSQNVKGIQIRGRRKLPGHDCLYPRP